MIPSGRMRSRSRILMFQRCLDFSKGILKAMECTANRAAAMTVNPYLVSA